MLKFFSDRRQHNIFGDAVTVWRNTLRLNKKPFQMQKYSIFCQTLSRDRTLNIFRILNIPYPKSNLTPLNKTNLWICTWHINYKTVRLCKEDIHVDCFLSFIAVDLIILSHVFLFPMVTSCCHIVPSVVLKFSENIWHFWNLIIF